MDFQEARSKVGVGWSTLLNKLWRARPAGCVITEVKRVDGRLHITATGVDAMFRPHIRFAEDESAKTCEDCGKNSGHRREMKGEILTLCDACYEMRERRDT